MEWNVSSSFYRPAQRQTCENRCCPCCWSRQGFFAAGWQGWQISRGSSLEIKAQNSEVCKIFAWSQKMSTSFLMRQKSRGPQNRGWHKVGFILCFLLTATFRLDQIFLLNPTDIRHKALDWQWWIWHTLRTLPRSTQALIYRHFYYTIYKSIGQLAFLHLTFSNIG